MRKLPLGHNLFALVDNEDFEYLNQFKWHYTNGYPARWIRKYERQASKDERTILRLHRAIMKPPENMLVDHINHNKLDNRKENLRICNKSQNCMNRHKRSDNTTGYAGITRVRSGRYVVRVGFEGKRIHLGTFDILDEAIYARRNAEKKYHGEFAFNVSFLKKFK